LEEQITKIFPRRLTSLQKSQIRRTLDRTFIGTPAFFRHTGSERL